MSKRKPKQSSGAEAKFCQAVFRLIETGGWTALTMEKVARATKTTPEKLRQRYADKAGILEALVRHITAETEAAVGVVEQGEPRDRLFEVMMTRFDVLQHYRPAILKIMSESKKEPSTLCTLAKAQSEAMSHMLGLAALDVTGPRKQLAIAGLCGVYGATLFAWSRDEGLDMSKTMAALDRYLRLASRLAVIMFRVEG